MILHVPKGLKEEYEKAILNNWPEHMAKALEEGVIEVIELEKIVVSPWQKIRGRLKRTFKNFKIWLEMRNWR